MQALAKPHRRTRPSLHLLVLENPDLKAEIPKIRITERKYLQSRDPHCLPPLNLSAQIGKFLVSRYETAAKKYRLDWIDSLRTNHGLHSCPMCGSTGVGTLEHYLPKELYPEFSVFTYNLFPCCQSCNQKRGQKGASTPIGESFIHPYFDHDVLNRVLMCTTFHPPYEAVRFGWCVYGIKPSDRSRLERHLRESIVVPLFKNTMQALWNVWRQRAFKANNVPLVQKRLQEELNEWEVNGKNSWEMWFMRGLAANTSAIAWMTVNSPSH